MITSTEKEIAVLQAILDSEYQSHEGEGCIEYEVYSFSVNPFGEDKHGAKVFAGVVRSLLDKGLVGIDEFEGENTIWITCQGFSRLSAPARRSEA